MAFCAAEDCPSAGRGSGIASRAHRGSRRKSRPAERARSNPRSCSGLTDGLKGWRKAKAPTEWPQVMAVVEATPALSNDAKLKDVAEKICIVCLAMAGRWQMSAGSRRIVRPILKSTFSPGHTF